MSGGSRRDETHDNEPLPRLTGAEDEEVDPGPQEAAQAEPEAEGPAAREPGDRTLSGRHQQLGERVPGSFCVRVLLLLVVHVRLALRRP